MSISGQTLLGGHLLSKTQHPMKPLAMYGRVDDSSGYHTLLLKDSKILSFYIP